MPKVEINKVAEVCKKNQMEPVMLRRIIEELNLLLGDAEEKPEAVKKQYVILVSDPEGRLIGDFAGWIMQIPETESVATTQERIFRSAYNYNCTKKGRLYPAKTVGEAIENIPAKFFKEADLWIKTKTPVLVLKTDNVIPRDTAKAA